jgi:hypothetical protein
MKIKACSLTSSVAMGRVDCWRQPGNLLVVQSRAKMSKFLHHPIEGVTDKATLRIQWLSLASSTTL